MSNYLLIKQGTIHNAIEEEPFVADILVENKKDRTGLRGEDHQ